jgi:hypothetical protein
MLFCLVIESTATFFSCWCGAYQWWWGGLSLMDLSFFFLLLSLSSSENYNLALFVVGI